MNLFNKFDVLSITKSLRMPQGALQVGTSGVKTLIEATTLKASDSGSTIFLNLADGFATTLPAPAAGLEFTFIVKTAPTTAYTIVTEGSANIIVGLQNSAAGDAGDTGATDDTISFVASQAVAGDKVELISDGTSWFAHARSKVAAGVTFTTAG